MNPELYEMIYKRKSFHLFRNIGDEKISEEELQEIEAVYKTLLPLNPDIRTAVRVVKAEETTCRRGQEYCILMYSEKKENYLQNIGYLGEQLDLWLVSKNIGTLWFGIGKVEESSFDGMDFIIMIAISKVNDPARFRKNMFKSKRKPVEEIWEGPVMDGVTDIARFAPSACNTQPWITEYIKAAETSGSRDFAGKLKVYRYKKPGKRGIMPADKVTFYNQIDMGIYLCFLELCLEHEGIEYKRELHVDEGTDGEKILNAVFYFE